MGCMNSKVYAKHKMGDKVKPVLVTGPGLTKQEFANEADINSIMKRYTTTGQLSNRIDGLQPIFADVSNVGDYADVLRRIDSAREAFAQLPAAVRSRFGNRPEALIDFLQDSKNLKEAVDLGLVTARPEPAPVVVDTPVVPALPVVK